MHAVEIDRPGGRGALVDAVRERVERREHRGAVARDGAGEHLAAAAERDVRARARIGMARGAGAWIAVVPFIVVSP